jgi:S-adenosylmethionine:tRNA ribosyltransferase-isomerase
MDIPAPLASATSAARPAICTGASDFSLAVLSVGEFGRCSVRLRWRGDLAAQFLELGHLPLPPYIRRPDTPADRERYQTVYADAARTGSVAAPTAGLHFTPEIRAVLAARGFRWAEVTLYVGYGTFSPVRCADIREHGMHREYLEVPEATAAAVRAAAAEGRPIVAVGTTSVRALEGAAQATDTRAANLAPFLGWTDIYLYPGREFRVTGHMLTNFHLPESSLVIMVSAFAGRERILSAYSQAIASGFRFFSYGDSMLLL